MFIDFSNVNGGGGGGYVLPTATENRLGGVIVGSGLSITSAGTLSADAQPVGIATTASTGVVKIGEGINVDSAGTISVDVPEISVATTASTGVVKIGQGINVDSAGTISVSGGSGGGNEVVTELPASGTDGQVVVLVDSATSSITEYVWSDEEIPSVDVNLGGCVERNGENCYSEVEFYFDEIPSFTGSAFTICQIHSAGVDLERYRTIRYTSGGTFEWYSPVINEGTPIELQDDGNMHYVFDGWLDRYLISDRYIRIIGTPCDSDASCIVSNGESEIGYDKLWNGQINKSGWVELGRKGITQKGAESYVSFQFYANGERKLYSTYGINIFEPPYPNGGNKFLCTPNGEQMQWVDLVIPKIEICQSLPYGGNEGDIVLTNSEYYPYTAASFITRNSTSESDKNNFTNSDEIGWYEYGSNYIYFGNASAYTNTKDTFLYKIALRTNENSDWSTSELAYINVVKRNGSYEIFMDNFNYYDTGGTPIPYTFYFSLNQTGATSANTSYLPLWRWWDGGYGYKFHFELDQDNNLTMYMRHSGVDSDNQEPDYIEGETYGDVPFRCMNHTEVFYDYINLDQDDTHISIYKGGAWYELGYLTRQQV